MDVKKVLNNNVAFSENELGQEIVVMGRGLGFKKKPGDVLDDAAIEKVFVLSQKGMVDKFYELLMEIPIEYVDISDKIIKYGQIRLGKPLNTGILLSLTDHIFYAVKRFKENITVPNGLLWEIKRLYADEFAVGQKAIAYIEEDFDVKLPEDEAGFIALHIVNGELDEGIPTIVSMTKVMDSILNMIKEFFATDFDNNSLSYHRFITHLKFFSQRLVTNTPYENCLDKALFKLVKNKYKRAFECAQKIKVYIDEKYDYIFSDEELFYMTLHIERVIHHTTI